MTMNIIKINKEHYKQIDATTWLCKHSDWKLQYINLRDGGNKKDYWGFCDNDGVDWKVEWFNPNQTEYRKGVEKDCPQGYKTIWDNSSWGCWKFYKYEKILEN